MPTLTADSTVARAILAANRPVRCDDATTPPELMARHQALAVWYDPEHAFVVAAGCLAMRAITDAGRFCWLVRQAGARDGLSYVKNPYDVVPARGDDDGMNVPYDAVTELAAALRRGEIRLPLAPGDFRGNGLAVRLLARRGMPGWMAAWLLPLAPGIGRAIWAGHRRTLEMRRLRLAMARIGEIGGRAAA